MIALGLRSVKMVNVFNATMEIFATMEDVQQRMIAQAMKCALEASVYFTATKTMIAKLGKLAITMVHVREGQRHVQKTMIALKVKYARVANV